jgi:DNA primase
MAIQRNAMDDIQKYTGMPPDASSLCFAPEQALVWLLKGGLTPELAEHRHGIMWHDASKRLLLPVRDCTLKDAGLLARAVNGERPKYKMIQGKPTLHFPVLPTQKIMVLTEDMLSAIAVASSGYDSAALLGTSINGIDTAILTQAADTIVSFTDPDKAGRDAYVKMRKAFAVHGCKLVRATAERDPKYLSRDQIRGAIDEALRS